MPWKWCWTMEIFYRQFLLFWTNIRKMFHTKSCLHMMSEGASLGRWGRIYSSQTKSTVCGTLLVFTLPWLSPLLKLICLCFWGQKYQNVFFLNYESICQDKSWNDICSWKHHGEPAPHTPTYGSGYCHLSSIFICLV